MVSVVSVVSVLGGFLVVSDVDPSDPLCALVPVRFFSGPRETGVQEWGYLCVEGRAP